MLGRFDPEERAVLDRFLRRTQEAVTTVLLEGTVEAMNRFNDRRGQISEEP